MSPVDVGTPVDEVALVRGLQDARLAAPGTVVGGYAQLQAAWQAVGPDPEVSGTATVRRLVVFVAHDFGSWGVPVRAYTELEWENAVAGDGEPGSAEVEQAFLQADLAGEALAVRAGLVLVPMGIVNQWHEPPVFHGVERPDVDQIVIPTTWRELGVGLVGRPGVLRYEVYAHTALDPTGFDADGIGGGRRSGAAAPALAVAFSGRVEVEPTLGAVFGLAGYTGDTGPAADWYDAAGARLDLVIPVFGAAVDGRWRGRGVELRAVGAWWGLPESDDLLEAYRADGSRWFPEGSGAVPGAVLGAYVEAGWNVLQPTNATAEVVPFVRLEHLNTQLAVPEGWDADPTRVVDVATFGITCRPLPGVAVKTDLQLRDRRYGDDALGWGLGLGWMF